MCVIDLFRIPGGFPGKPLATNWGPKSFWPRALQAALPKDIQVFEETLRPFPDLKAVFRAFFCLPHFFVFSFCLFVCLFSLFVCFVCLLLFLFFARSFRPFVFFPCWYVFWTRSHKVNLLLLGLFTQVSWTTIELLSWRFGFVAWGFEPPVSCRHASTFVERVSLAEFLDVLVWKDHFSCTRKVWTFLGPSTQGESC